VRLELADVQHVRDLLQHHDREHVDDDEVDAVVPLHRALQEVHVLQRVGAFLVGVGGFLHSLLAGRLVFLADVGIEAGLQAAV
jgi:hypothetical protein